MKYRFYPVPGNGHGQEEEEERSIDRSMGEKINYPIVQLVYCIDSCAYAHIGRRIPYNVAFCYLPISTLEPFSILLQPTNRQVQPEQSRASDLHSNLSVIIHSIGFGAHTIDHHRVHTGCTILPHNKMKKKGDIQSGLRSLTDQAVNGHKFWCTADRSSPIFTERYE